MLEGRSRSPPLERSYLTLTLTDLLKSVAPAAVALTHDPIAGTAAAGTSAQAWLVTSVSEAVSLARSA